MKVARIFCSNVKIISFTGQDCVSERKPYRSGC